ncbi:unnamed protein product (macronuclear) [Paramecium tetraurelia]|uniref:Transmembrane protein n=1 Tax=Paramecium tetraurelia TaxID=5888 RepID=A0D5Y5_PARTE|nr:uncharacterized protein GSPATT00013882001 [Paramecium tetraurelia]CAK78452.1 unnamed protein product [Paramecium tetraurelia]|eukprot:XP_001445849.1 hypothetical protein (macronuclear) [Paramecium tetraurelia strain d4-2]
MKLLVLILIACLVIAQAQEDLKQKETTQQESENLKDEINASNVAEGKSKSRTKEEIIKERDTLQTLLKTLNYSCIVLARMQLSRYKSELMKVIESHQTKQEQSIVWKKIYTSYVSQCQKSITYDDSVKIFSQIQSKEFKFDDYRFIYDNMSLEDYSNDKVDMHITQAEEKIWQYIQDFEKAMDSKDEEDDDSTLKRNFDLEPKVFGFSLKSVKSLQYIMFFLFVSFILFLGYIAFKKLPKQYEDQKKKRRN